MSKPTTPEVGSDRPVPPKRREPSCTRNHEMFRRELRDKALPPTPCPNCNWLLSPAREADPDVDTCLMAAAPEMLDALKLVVAWRDGPEGPEILFNAGATMLRSVRAAIAKAEGR